MDSIKKSTMASLLISLGVYILLMDDGIIGAVLFSLGLLSICKLKLNLFTGKCGFIYKYKIQELVGILFVNLVTGYLFGYLYRYSSVLLIPKAIDKVVSWNITPEYFIKSLLCGAIMYLAVLLYNQGTAVGILLGVPLFIMCGFQHCIANVVTMGIASTFNISILLCIAGNWCGSLCMNWLMECK